MAEADLHRFSGYDRPLYVDRLLTRLVLQGALIKLNLN